MSASEWDGNSVRFQVTNGSETREVVVTATDEEVDFNLRLLDACRTLSLFGVKPSWAA